MEFHPPGYCVLKQAGCNAQTPPASASTGKRRKTRQANRTGVEPKHNSRGYPAMGVRDSPEEKAEREAEIDAKEA